MAFQLGLVMAAVSLLLCVSACDGSDTTAKATTTMAETASTTPPFRVAVVGAGIGGAATAWFAREELPEGATIDVYERDQRVGGRAESIELEGEVHEAGGSVVHVKNEYMVAFAKALNLTRGGNSYRKPEDSQGAGVDIGPGMGVLDASSLLWTTWSSKWVTKLTLLWRYGLSLLTMRSFVDTTLQSFVSVYPAQAAGRAFDSPEEMLNFMGLFNLTQVSLRRALIDARVGNRLIDELCTAVSRVNYGQSTDQLNGLTGAIALAASSSTDLWAVKGGNSQIASGLLSASGARVLLGRRVGEVVAGPAASSYTVVTDDGNRAEYDAIVFATPLEEAGIELPPGAASAVVPRKLQTTHATFVEGELRPSFFGVETAAEVPLVALTTEHPDNAISSVGRLGERTFKVFSRQPVDEALLSRMFQDGARIVARRPWKAYPRYGAPQRFSNFTLDPSGGGGLIYNNAIETAGSAFEMSAIAAKNAALLLARRHAAVDSNNQRTTGQPAEGDPTQTPTGQHIEL
eukprot:m.95967 g.95967  ORF g.95967 m.95967 type:complete len:517 (-) comp15175_c0_seq1:1361-2911(-)